MAVVLTDNEFLTGLSNLALIVKNYATNDSGEPEKFVNSFLSENLPSGNTKIFTWSDLPTVTDYAEKSSLLEVTKVKAGEEYLQITERKVIKSSYSRQILEMAFTSEDGMNEFIGYILGQMESAKINYLYNMIVSDLYAKSFTGAKQTHNIQQYDLSKATSFTELQNGRTINAENVYKEITFDINNIQVYSNNYNELNNTEAIDIGNVRLVLAEPFVTEQSINLYATLLNSKVLNEAFDKPQLLKIPQIKVPEASQTIVKPGDMVGILMHRFAYQIFYKFTFMGSFFDESNLVVNNFLHFWFGKGWLKNLPAIRFNKIEANLPATK